MNLLPVAFDPDQSDAGWGSRCESPPTCELQPKTVVVATVTSSVVLVSLRS